MNMSDSDSLVRALEPRYYTDREIFERERTNLLSQTWQYAGHASDLQNAGDYFTFTIAGQNLFCIKSHDGQIRAFYNVCRHRAHELLTGKGNKKRIACPYHAWTYELNGQLKSGPNLSAVIGLDISKICLKSVRLENWYNFLFVNLDDDAASMDEWYPQIREELFEYLPQIARMAPMEPIIVSEKCNWKISVENYSECYHCKINHRSLSTGVIKADSYDIQPQGYCLRHTAECQNLDKLSYAIDVVSNKNADKYGNWYLWPMFAFQIYPGSTLNTYCWREIDESNVEVYRGWYTLDGKEDRMINELAKQDLETTIAEDIRLVESVQRGMRSRGYTPGPLVLDPNFGVNSEHSIQVVQEWMRQGVEPL